MIEIKNVSVSRGTRLLFENLNLTIADDEHVLLTGQSGSGKTLLLELLSGNIHPTSGEVSYSFLTEQQWEQQYNERKNKILYVPAHALHAFVHGHSLFYQQRYYSMGDEMIPKVKDVLLSDGEQSSFQFPKTFGLENLWDVEVTRLSNGQLKKLLILKSFSEKIPKLLLLDFPFEGLDIASRKDFSNFLTNIVEAYQTQVVLVDHHHDVPAFINRKIAQSDFRLTAWEEFIPREVKEDSITQGKVAEHSGQPVVEMKNVSIHYGDKVIINSLNWTIRKGERWALTGKNGSGKTTLFGLIYADHPRAYSEEIHLFGKRRGTGESIWDIKRRIGYLGPELLSFLETGNNLILAIDLILDRASNKDKRKLEALESFFDAGQYIRKPIRELSSGQLQMVLIITLLMGEEELLLLDEPFQFLDPAQKNKVKQYLLGHLKYNTTLVLISHYEEDLREWTGKRFTL